MSSESSVHAVRSRPIRRGLGAVRGVAVVPTLFVAGVVLARPSGADTAPPPGAKLPSTVTADVLPTAQVNDGGVVW